MVIVVVVVVVGSCSRSGSVGSCGGVVVIVLAIAEGCFILQN